MEGEWETVPKLSNGTTFKKKQNERVKYTISLICEINNVLNCGLTVDLRLTLE